MLSFLVLASALSISSAQTPLTGPIDVTTLTVTSQKSIVELDLGKLKGDLRQIGWSPDATKLYIQTVDGDPGSEKIRHYMVAADGGPVEPIPAEPDWAQAYWAYKSDRSAPGLGSIMIDVQQKAEGVKIGTGSGRPDDVGKGGDAANMNLNAATESQKQNVIRLMVFDEAISEFVNQRPVPGLMFSWGPAASATIAYTTLDGHLILLDRGHHKQTVAGAKDALLPAWTTDGSRLAWVQKAGRKKYVLVWATVSRG
ncbi:MAG TPA: hypothetical protein VGH34_23465 [Vicinamibacterales bacterium]|jgi:hypothetical protein